MDWYAIATSPIMWIVGIITAGNSLIQTTLFLRVARKTAPRIGLTGAQVSKALKTGVVASIGPSLGSFIGMIVLVLALGGPIAFIRESAGIGSIMYEMMMAKTAADAAGAPLTREGMTMLGVATVVWGMALTCVPWLITGGIGARFLPRLKETSLGKKPGLMAQISVCAMLGLFGKSVLDYIVLPVQKTTPQVPAAFIAGGLAALVWILLSLRLKKPELRQFTLLVVIAIGMTVGQIVAGI